MRWARRIEIREKKQLVRFARAWRFGERLVDGGDEQRKHQLVMPGERNAAASAAGGPLNHVHARPIVADEIHISGGDAIDPAPWLRAHHLQ